MPLLRQFALAAFAALLAATPLAAVQSAELAPAPLEIAKSEAPRYQAMRSGLKSALAEFDRLAKQGEKGISPETEAGLKATAKKINDHARVLQSLSQAAGNDVGMALAGQLLINDDILGRQPTEIAATARRLLGVQGKLGLLEPVVHR